MRPIRYADIIRAESPNARSRYFEGRNIDTQQQQYDEGIALQKKANDAAQKQARISNDIAATGTAYMVGGPVAATAYAGGKFLFGKDGLKSMMDRDTYLYGGKLGKKAWHGLGGTFRDIGDKTTNFLKNPTHGVTSTVKDLGDKATSFVKNPAKAFKKVSYLCTAVNDTKGIPEEDRKLLSEMYQFALDKHPVIGNFYKEFGPQLVGEIMARDDFKRILDAIEIIIIQPTVELLKAGEMEAALFHYQKETWSLFRKFTDLIPPEV